MTAQHDGPLRGRAALVTGAGAGIGRGVALALASAGATVVAAGRTRSTLDGVVAEIVRRGGRALAVRCDVRDLDSITQCLGVIRDEVGKLDTLVNNAQTYRHAALLEATDDDLADTWASGPQAVFRLMRLAHPLLAADGGVIFNFGSGVQLDPSDSFHGTYAAAKNAIGALTRTAAVEWGKDGIRTFLIVPAAESDQLAAFRTRDPERYAAMLGRVPLGRFGDPEVDIGRPIAWLAGPEATFMTGTTIMLDGGQMYLR